MYIKKIFVSLLMICVPMFVYATSMCVHTDSYVAQLSSGRDGVSQSTDGNGGWTVTMDYFTSSFNDSYVKGSAACTEASGTENAADSTVSAAAGEDSGVNCWCAMNVPLVSDWVNAGAYASISACTSVCAAECATRVRTSSTFRSAMFQAIW